MMPTLPRLTRKGKQSAPYKYDPAITTETYTSPCTTRVVDPVELAEELDRQYGDRLKPVRCKLKDRKPVVFGFRK